TPGRRPACCRRCTSAIAKGVLPVPPALMLPTTTTGTSTRCARNRPRRYKPRRRPVSAPYSAASRPADTGTGVSPYQCAGGCSRLCFMTPDSCVAELHLVQAAVEPVAGQQFGVGPLLHQFAMFQHQHLVGVLDGGQAMGDD